MDKVINIEEALKRIEELEKENAKLREELEYYRNRKLSGRQKHNAKWMAIYNDFVVGYESGMTMVEIAKRNNVSERTIYRYKAYYDKLFANGQVATQYADFNGNISMDEEWNVNGSYAAIEGITSPDGRCLGKMAHVERRGESVAINIYGEQDLKIFESGVKYFK